MKELLIVPSHALYTGTSNLDLHNDKAWQGKYDKLYYMQHIDAGLKLADIKKAVLIFSGGINARGYYNAAKHENFLGFNLEILLEDLSKNSLQQLEKSFLTFINKMGYDPTATILCGWEFQRERYLNHAATIGISSTFQYIGVNNPPDTHSKADSP